MICKNIYIFLDNLKYFLGKFLFPLLQMVFYLKGEIPQGLLVQGSEGCT